MVNEKGQFMKGHIPQMKGTRGILKATPGSFKKGHMTWLGKKLSEEHKRKISEGGAGRIPWNKGKQHLAKEKNPNWQGGITDVSAQVRNSLEIRQWRKAVFERDDYRCMACGERGGKLVADHILPFSKFPRLRLDTNNGRALCESCHKQTETYLVKAKSFSLEGRPTIHLTQ